MTPTQTQIYYMTLSKSARLDQAMLEMLYGPNPITDDELKKLITKRPEMYGRFAGYIGKRKVES